MQLDNTYVPLSILNNNNLSFEATALAIKMINKNKKEGISSEDLDEICIVLSTHLAKKYLNELITKKIIYKCANNNYFLFDKYIAN